MKTPFLATPTMLFESVSLRYGYLEKKVLVKSHSSLIGVVLNGLNTNSFPLESMIAESMKVLLLH
jgi:hypothetical protein